MSSDANVGEARNEGDAGEMGSACVKVSSNPDRHVSSGTDAQSSGKIQMPRKKRERRPIIPGEPYASKSRHLGKLTLVAAGMRIMLRELSGCQIRNKHIDPATVERYMELLSISEPPPIVVIKDASGRMYIADGHNRAGAFARAGRKYIIADVYEGTMADARVVGLELNQGALPMSMAERKAMLDELLDNPNLGYSTIELAAMTAMSKNTVEKRKKERDEGDFLSTMNGMKRPKTPEEKLADAAKAIIRHVEKNGAEAVIKALNELPAHIREDITKHLINKA